MQITLVPDSLSPLTLLFWFPDCLTPIRPPSWRGAIFQYGGRAQFFVFFKIALFEIRHFTIWLPARYF